MSEKEKILELATNKLFKGHFYKTSMDELAKELAISKKTIYKHFSSKEELSDQIVNKLLETINLQHDAILSSKSNALVKIQKIFESVSKVFMNITQESLYDIRIHQPGLWNSIHEFREERLTKNFNVIINQGKKEKLFVDKPNQIIQTIFLSSMQAVINPNFLINNNFSIKEAAETVQSIILAGILTEKGKEILNKQGK